MDRQPATSEGASHPVPFRTDEQVSAREVAKITGLSRKRIAEVAALGYLTTWRPPAGIDGPVRYSRASAEALARTLVTPATSPTARSTEAATNDTRA